MKIQIQNIYQSIDTALKHSTHIFEPQIQEENVQHFFNWIRFRISFDSIAAGKNKQTNI